MQKKLQKFESWTLTKCNKTTFSIEMYTHVKVSKHFIIKNYRCLYSSVFSINYQLKKWLQWGSEHRTSPVFHIVESVRLPFYSKRIKRPSLVIKYLIFDQECRFALGISCLTLGTWYPAVVAWKLEVEHPLRIQLKAYHYCLSGWNPAWGDFTN